MVQKVAEYKPIMVEYSLQALAAMLQNAIVVIAHYRKECQARID